MLRTALTIARFCLAAWVGAAAMFVTIGVREVTFPGFDSATRDQLALLRFPAYYVSGFALVTLAWIALACCLIGRKRTRTLVVAAACVSLALVLMAVDYVAIYTPLAEMVSPPGAVKPAQFESLHARSEWINMADVGLCLIAALLLCWSERVNVTDASPGDA